MHDKKTKKNSGNLDFENLSNSLFEEWNSFEPPQTLDTDSQTNLQRNRIELEAIFVRVGLHTSIASKVADEVYEKLGRRTDQTISFNDFLSLIQCDTELMRQPHAPNKVNNDDEYTTPLNIIDDSMMNITNIDLHAHSGLSFPYFLFSLSTKPILLFSLHI